MSIFEYLKLPDKELNIGIASLILSKEVYPNIKFKKYLAIIKKLSSEIFWAVGDRTDPEYHISAINTCLFRKNDYGYDMDDFYGQKTKNHFLTGILDTKKGVCTSLPLLYMVVAERLNYPIYGIHAPQHFYCRYYSPDYYGKGKPYISNIEVTGGGGENPDVFYIEDMKIPKKAYKNEVYCKTLSKREYIASLLVGNAAVHFKSGNTYKAIKYLETAVKYDTNNSQAYHFLGNLYKKLYFIKLKKLDSLKDQKLLITQNPHRIKNNMYYGNFPNNNNTTIRPQIPKARTSMDILNESINNPNKFSSVNNSRQISILINQHQQKAIYYKKELEANYAKVNELGIAPPCPKEYWKEYFNKVQLDIEKDLKNGKTKKVKYTVNGIEYEMDILYLKRLHQLEEKYNDYFEKDK